MKTINEPVILFDGICNLCNRSVQFILKYDKKEIFKFTTLHSQYASELLRSYQYEKITDSVLLVDNGKLYQQSTAALMIARQLKYFWILYPLIYLPKWLRDTFYDFVAKNRYQWFGKRESCMMPDEKFRKRFL